MQSHAQDAVALRRRVGQRPGGGGRVLFLVSRLAGLSVCFFQKTQSRDRSERASTKCWLCLLVHETPLASGGGGDDGLLAAAAAAAAATTSAAIASAYFSAIQPLLPPIHIHPSPNSMSNPPPPPPRHRLRHNARISVRSRHCTFTQSARLHHKCSVIQHHAAFAANATAFLSAFL